MKYSIVWHAIPCSGKLFVPDVDTYHYAADTLPFGTVDLEGRFAIMETRDPSASAALGRSRGSGLVMLSSRVM